MTVEQELQVTRLREQGYGYATIAKSTGLTKNAVVVFCRKKGGDGLQSRKQPYKYSIRRLLIMRKVNRADTRKKTHKILFFCVPLGIVEQSP